MVNNNFVIYRLLKHSMVNPLTEKAGASRPQNLLTNISTSIYKSEKWQMGQELREST